MARLLPTIPGRVATLATCWMAGSCAIRASSVSSVWMRSVTRIPISVVLTAEVIELFGYRSIFAVLAAMIVVEVIVSLRVDDAAAKDQVRGAEFPMKSAATVS
jgi:hypothetical protein